MVLDATLLGEKVKEVSLLYGQESILKFVEIRWNKGLNLPLYTFSFLSLIYIYIYFPGAGSWKVE